MPKVTILSCGTIQYVLCTSNCVAFNERSKQVNFVGL